MVRINASRIAAGMVNYHADGNRTYVEFVTHPMGGRSVPAFSLDDAITLPVPSTRPNPATRHRVDFDPSLELYPVVADTPERLHARII